MHLHLSYLSKKVYFILYWTNSSNLLLTLPVIYWCVSSGLLRIPTTNLSVGQQKKVLTIISSPPIGTDKRGWYTNKTNCPIWWSRPSANRIVIPWQSPNHPPQWTKFLTVKQCHTVIESYKAWIQEKVNRSYPLFKCFNMLTMLLLSKKPLLKFE